MLDFKEEISKKISEIVDIPQEEMKSYIEIPKGKENGDYAFPCFRLAKELKKSPQEIANEIKEKLEENKDGNLIESIEVTGGYVNFMLNKELIAKTVLTEFTKPEQYGESQIGKGKNIVVDYSAPNIAKPFHIGHLRSTVIGGALYKVFKYLGYNLTGINYIGDYGTQFGKLIEGYKLWGDEYDIDSNPIDELTKIYVRINTLCKEDESVLEACRDNFKKLEDGEEYCTKIWKKFKDVSLKEFQRVYDLLGTEFDSWNGEAFYSDKMQEVIDLLEEKGALTDSEGARIVDLEDEGINTPCLMQKSNGSTTYETRDVASILYRIRTYNFDRALYVTSYEQVLHFKQVFAVAKKMGIDKKYAEGLEHVPFGMVQLATGKMSTREGNIIKLEDLLNEAIERAKVIIEEKNPDLENKEEVAKKVGIGAVIFNDLSNNRVKDEIFDWDMILNFQGETGPYIQYTYVRTKSVLEKAGETPETIKQKLENSIKNNEGIEKKLEDKYSQDVLKLIYGFEDVLIQVTVKNEPSILSRYLIDVAQSFSVFYNENKIIVDDEEVKNARLYLTYCVGEILKIGSGLLGIQMPDKM